VSRLAELGGKRVPFLRWSFLRLLLGMKRLTSEWQVGDGREEALGEYVAEHGRAGDLDDVIRVIDEFCYEQSFMINVGDEKGELLDDALRRAGPQLILELGTYCGYSALRMARAMPEGARAVSIEFNAANAAIARRIWDHAGIADQLTVVVGTLGDGGETMAVLEAEHGFGEGSVDFAFLDHDKDAYLPDLRRILDRGWLRAGSVVVADNVKFPGVPEYRAFMAEQEELTWRTVEHETHVEYQSLIKDLVLESEYLGGTWPSAPIGE
jgi:catechol O-methyltransferase